MSKDKKLYANICRKLRLPENCPGLSWRKSLGLDLDLDEEILPLLKQLNKLPFCHTTGSCAGHSTGGWGINIPYLITITLHLKTDDRSIAKFIKILQAFDKVSDERFWCELGYKMLLCDMDDANKQVEKGYMPLEIRVFAKTKSRRNKFIEKYTNILKNKQY